MVAVRKQAPGALLHTVVARTCGFRKKHSCAISSELLRVQQLSLLCTALHSIACRTQQCLSLEMAGLSSARAQDPGDYEACSCSSPARPI